MPFASFRTVHGRHVCNSPNHHESFYPGKTETTTSILLASNGLGGSLLPIAVGWSLDEYPAQTAFWLFTALMLLMLLIVFSLRMLETIKSNNLQNHNSKAKSM